MAKFFINPFATAGTKTTVPDATDSSGYVSYNEGYGADYSRVLGTDPLAKAIERTKLNAVLYDITDAIKQYQTHGVPDFITTADNGGTAYPYSIYSIVRYDSGSGFYNYMSLKDNNTSLPTVTSDWKVDPFNTNIAALIHAATSKSTPVDADELGIADSAASYGLKKLTWANLKATILSYLLSQNISRIIQGTAVATTSGTAIDFTGIPSWAKKITVMFNGVSTNGSSNLLVQLGSGAIQTTGYDSSSHQFQNTNASSTAGFILTASITSAVTIKGSMIISQLSSNTYVEQMAGSATTSGFSGGGSVTLSGTLNTVRITTVNGTDAFDAGSVNILIEG